MPTESDTKKQLWILAGGNGAGKSTYFNRFLAPKNILFVNADLIARKINPASPETVSYEAATRAEKLRFQMLDQGVSFCFETVFSHPSKIDFVAKAKALGYEVVLVYIHLELPQLNAARVRQRVSEGGHAVPEEKILSRIPRAMDNVVAAIPLADTIFLVDNASFDRPFRPVVVILHGKIKKHASPPPDWARDMLGGVI